jgi:hypothetical protein
MRKRHKGFLDLTGQTFNYLTVICFHSVKNRLTRWLCKCKCGKEVIKYGTLIRIGRVKSCGCYKGEKTLAPGKASMHFLHDNYKRRARKKNLLFELNEQQFENLTSSKCFYCNKDPIQSISSKRYNGAYLYNGIDRLDNKLGYTINNCVPCCGLCNQMKMTESLQDFYNHLIQIVKNRDLIK